ncbi:MAG: LacI family transcriptional regulator [Verrucomicrobia bacterium]|nr:LacI family transcriptional regulator [Verrucomicrobiota bacterium]NBR62978.1 LacI family transcriptional regulator [Verrucomicrobiota bacterium]
MVNSGHGKVSLQAIATRTGVSRMAVSLALRHRPGISEKTRRRILRVARKIGYAPDPELGKMMARLRQKTSTQTRSCLAYLIPGSAAGHRLVSLTEEKYSEGARERAGEYGYRLEEFWIDEPGMPLSRLVSILWNRGIEGVIFAPLQQRLSGTSPRRIEMDVGKFAAVEISETIESPPLDRATSDPYASMVRVLEEVHRAGYRRPGLVLEEALDFRVGGKWTAAFLRFHHSQTELPPPFLVVVPRQNEFDRWFERHRPDVIVSVDRLGLRLLRGRGELVPGNVGYASLDIDGDRADFPEVSGIDQNSRLVGAAAVDLVVAAIQRGQRGPPPHPVRTVIEGSWRTGKTIQRQPVPAGRREKDIYVKPVRSSRKASSTKDSLPSTFVPNGKTRSQQP